jgi:hypothetical protein
MASINDKLHFIATNIEHFEYLTQLLNIDN